MAKARTRQNARSVAYQLTMATAAHDWRNRLSIAGCEIQQTRSKLASSACDAACLEILASVERSLAEANSHLETLLELTRKHIRVPDSASTTDLVALARRLIA